MPVRPGLPLSQDWEPVVLRRSRPKAQQLRAPSAVNQALRSGADVRTVKKIDAGSNKNTMPLMDARKLEQAAEPSSLGRISSEVKQAIQKARVEKKLSQADLAKQIYETPRVVQEYESGKAFPNQKVLEKMEKALGVKLRGKMVAGGGGGK
ncbi:Multiprotein-bridging factor 1c [Ranunculus cassubicifolius]